MEFFSWIAYRFIWLRNCTSLPLMSASQLHLDAPSLFICSPIEKEPHMFWTTQSRKCTRPSVAFFGDKNVLIKKNIFYKRSSDGSSDDTNKKWICKYKNNKKKSFIYTIHSAVGSRQQWNDSVRANARPLPPPPHATVILIRQAHNLHRETEHRAHVYALYLVFSAVFFLYSFLNLRRTKDARGGLSMESSRGKYHGKKKGSMRTRWSKWRRKKKEMRSGKNETIKKNGNVLKKSMHTISWINFGRVAEKRRREDMHTIHFAQKLIYSNQSFELWAAKESH